MSIYEIITAYVVTTFIFGIVFIISEVKSFDRNNISDLSIKDYIVVFLSGGLWLFIGIVCGIMWFCEKVNLGFVFKYVTKFANWQPFKKLTPEEKMKKSALYKAMNE